jgi:WD40 repeat protein
MNDQVICGGTELVEEDSYVLFWDVRSTRLLGAYWESHSDDITTVNFSPVNGNKLATGSTDGLLNIFDLREASEDDALLFSFNSESSVDAVCWGNFLPSPSSEEYSAVACLTHTNEIQTFSTETGDLVAKFDRKKVAESYKRSREEAVYLQGSYRIDDKGSLGILVSSLAGNCARISKLEEDSLSPFCLFSDQLSLIQSASRFHKSNRWFTFDEEGVSKIWEPSPSSSKPSKPKRTKKSKS